MLFEPETKTTEAEANAKIDRLNFCLVLVISAAVVSGM